MRWCCGVFLMVTMGMAVSGVADDVDTQAWWKSAVLYQIYPRSFKDSDGNGIGDLKGITQMAGYFKELGVDAVWLSPIFRSPMVDFGYDITDFRNIDPMFGTMQDFEELVATFRKLDVKILLDFVPNHTSDEHDWFQKSVANDTDYRDFYVWEDPKYLENGTRIPPNNWLSLFGGPAWTWSEQRQQYYLHQFAIKQPDLNYRNPAVIGNMTDVFNFWLDKGVDGFRMDAVPYVVEAKNLTDEPPLPGTTGDTWEDMEHLYTKNQPETYALMLHWTDVVYNRVKQDGRKRLVVLEAYDETPVIVKYYGQGTEDLQVPFCFNLQNYGNLSARAPTIKFAIYDWIDQVPKGGQLNWVVGNHDNQRVANRYGPEMVDSINLLTGTLPGIQVIYNGEEIGMQDTFVQWDETVDPIAKNVGKYRYLKRTRDPERTPMQWDDSVSAGFSTNHTTWLPVNPNYWWLNVNAQRNSNNSHMKVSQKMHSARKDPVLLHGDLNVITPDNDTLVIVRNYQGNFFLLLINMGSKSREFTSHNFFANYSLDASVYVVVSSINAGYSTGQFMQQGSLSVTLRPKAAILLTTKPWAPSPTPTPTPAPTPSSSTSKPSGALRLIAESPLLGFAVLILIGVWL